MKYYQNYSGGYISETWCFIDYSNKLEFFTFRGAIIYGLIQENLEISLLGLTKKF